MAGRRQMVAGDGAGQRAGSRREKRVVRLAYAAVVAVALATVSASDAPAQPLTISHFAGTLGGGGVLDGTGAGARFNHPAGLAVDAAGTIYVADTYSHTVRRISAAGVVTTLAGLAGTPGITDGTGNAARFNYPYGVAVDGAGNVFVADGRNHTVRKITAGGVVTTLAGLPAVGGSADGTAGAARFNEPRGIAVDGGGTIYVADTNNHTIRKIAAGGVVTTLAGLASTSGSADGTGSAARFNSPRSLAVDGAGTLWVADNGNHTIRRITAGGVVTTLAGLAGTTGSANGTGSSARFNYPEAVAVDSNGTVYVADYFNQMIRKITAAGVVTTAAGVNQVGSVDGTGSAARFAWPTGIAVDNDGVVYVGDSGNNAIRHVTPSGVVTTLAGFPAALGSADGTGSAARFNRPNGVAVGGTGALYVADSGNNTIRRIAAGGVVTTLAGLAGAYGSANGTGSAARFSYPFAIAVDGGGVVYVADTYNHTIRKISGSGEVTTLAGLASSSGTADGTGSAARFHLPQGVAVDGSGTVYVADTYNHTIRKITTGGVVTTFAGLAGAAGSTDGTGSTARFDRPLGIAVDGNGTVYVSSRNTIRRISSGGVVTTLAGMAGTFGSADGTGSAARFLEPTGVAVDSVGNVYVMDTVNQRVRRITPAGVVTTIAGGRIGSTDGTGSAVAFAWPAGIAVDGTGNVYIADSFNHAIRWSGTTPPPTLSLTKTGSGTGTVTSSPAGLDCGATCAAAFDSDSLVALSATPVTGSVFGGWSGACTGRSTCRVTMSGAQAVTATFLLLGTDTDADGLPDAWETQFGLDPYSATGADGASGDVDVDGVVNSAEYAAGTHPAGTVTRYLAEGATSTFFTTTLGLANPGTDPVHALLRFQTSTGATVPHAVTVPAQASRTVVVNTLPGLAQAEFATVVESDAVLAVHRMLTWDAASGYGSHLEGAVPAPATQWYLAEGSTNVGFQLFYLLQNPAATAAEVEIRYLLPAGAPVVRTYTVAPGTRFNVWANTDPALAATDVSAVVTVTNGVPIIVERAMYLDAAGQTFGAGHESAGVTAPATSWFLAEGATGPYFDMFVLLANPGDTPATVTATYLLPSGTTVSKTYTVDAQRRFTIWVDQEDALLADTAVSTTLVADVPILAERALWWPGEYATWWEAHNSFGATTTGTVWAVAGGEVTGPPASANTYVLLANTAATPASVEVTVLFEDGTAAARRTFAVAPTSRFNVDMAVEFPATMGRRFGVVVESVAANGQPVAPIVVETASYHNDTLGRFWAAGANALATLIR
ncbi:MAG: hypothetical protein JNM38_13345 [Acidobacteria bacterium]|nr:hypothetical protein [Acidobacteriota bacterium]